jgi:poly-beta-1,6-N-acetyl-D-glucosamine synthase
MAILYLFWISLGILVYTFLGYGLILIVFTSIRGSKPTTPDNVSNDDLPEVTLVVAAYNEEDFAKQKAKNSLALNYPKEKLSFFFVTDGSTDKTEEIFRSFPEISVFHEPQRRGKIHAVSRVMEKVSTPVTVFTDANTFLNKDAIFLMVRHYQDKTVGGVAGEKLIYQSTHENASGAGEGLYWKYESFLKRKDAELYSIVGAAGELFSIRTSLFEKPGEDIIIEDFYMSMRIAARGHRFAYEPAAVATESSSVSVSEEWKRKVRICAGAFQAMSKLLYLMNPFRYGVLSFQYVSHRVLRWTFAPLALISFFISNLIVASRGSAFYSSTLVLQVAFYLLALLGFFLQNKRIKVRGFFVPYYFVVMNAAVFAGFWRFLKGRQSVVWERAERAKTSDAGLQ